MSDAPPRRRVLRGILLLARFRPEGFAEFAATRQAFLNSLAPLIAFPLVGGVLVLLSGGGIGAVTDLFATLIALLAPPVISEALAGRWDRAPRWLRYSVAFNWAQWAVPIAAVALLMVAGMLRRMGLGEQPAAIAVLFAIAGYGLALHWFLARHGLALSAGRSAVMVLAINFGTVVLVMAPRFLAAAMR